MFRFGCENCSFLTNDETLPDCPICGGYLKENIGTEFTIPKDENYFTEDGDEDKDENYFGLTIE